MTDTEFLVELAKAIKPYTMLTKITIEIQQYDRYVLVINFNTCFAGNMYKQIVVDRKFNLDTKQFNGPFNVMLNEIGNMYSVKKPSSKSIAELTVDIPDKNNVDQFKETILALSKDICTGHMF